MSPFTPYFLFRLRKIYQTLETVFNRIFKHLQFCQKYSAAHGNFILFSVFGYPEETLSLVFDILSDVFKSLNSIKWFTPAS